MELFLAKLPITEESKANTSEPTRPIVLRLAALMLEPTNPLNPIASPPLTIESYHEDQLCVTVYDPTAGVRSVPLSDLLSYQVVGVHFKRSSTVQLICPKLLQRFAALPIPKAINTSHSKFSIISLFDGSGSFVDVISQALEAKLLWPTIQKTCCTTSIISLASQASNKPVLLMHLSFILNFLFLTFSHLFYGMN